MPTLKIDIAIIGGGIAGLWLLARLRQQGFSALLIENQQLGAGQTLCAQGIIHGGAKYSLHGILSSSAQAIAAMPMRWRYCLNGDGEIDLRGARLLATHQFLWATHRPASRLTAFFASTLMRDRMERVAGMDQDAMPSVLRHPRFNGVVYRLDEPVVDIPSVLQVFTERYRQAMLASQASVELKTEGNLQVQSTHGASLSIQPTVTVLTAGESNAQLPWVTSQLRPLHMVMARGSGLPGDLYAHCLGASEVPRLTITTHHDAQGRRVWYLGGGLAEDGVRRDRFEQIRIARQELWALLPWVAWDAVELTSFMIQRVEAGQSGGRRPATPSVLHQGRVIVAWPTKLAFAPLLADQIVDTLRALAVRPQCDDVGLPIDGWLPEVGIPPWDRKDLEWY